MSVEVVSPVVPPSLHSWFLERPLSSDSTNSTTLSQFSLQSLDSNTSVESDGPEELFTIPLCLEYKAVVSTIRRFTRARIDYGYDPEDEVKRETWDHQCTLLQSFLNRYDDLDPVSRDVLDICLDVWSAADVCVVFRQS